jgi:hypothetical protein
MLTLSEAAEPGQCSVFQRGTHNQPLVVTSGSGGSRVHAGARR